MRNFIMNKKFLWINIFLMFITYGIWIVIYFYLKLRYSKELNEDNNSTRTWILKLSGVTFKNDNGTDRQKYISKLYVGQELKLVPYRYNNEDAIYVKTLNNNTIGNIPAENVDEIMNKLSSNIISKVTVAENGTFENKQNKEIFYVKIKLYIKI